MNFIKLKMTKLGLILLLVFHLVFGCSIDTNGLENISDLSCGNLEEKVFQLSGGQRLPWLIARTNSPCYSCVYDSLSLIYLALNLRGKFYLKVYLVACKKCSFQILLIKLQTTFLLFSELDLFKPRLSFLAIYPFPGPTPQTSVQVGILHCNEGLAGEIDKGRNMLCSQLDDEPNRSPRNSRDSSPGTQLFLVTTAMNDLDEAFVIPKGLLNKDKEELLRKIREQVGENPE